MFIRPLLRIVPDHTEINFMKGRHAGLIVLGRAVAGLDHPVHHAGPALRHRLLAAASSSRLRTPAAADPAAIRAAMGEQGIKARRRAAVRRADASVLIRLPTQPTEAATRSSDPVGKVRAAVEKAQAGSRAVRTRRGGRGGRRPSCSAMACWRVGPQPADDPRLYLVPLRMAVRRRRGGDADARRDQGGRASWR
jgi:hypothetical protein